MTEGYTQELAAFAHGLTLSDVPPEVVEKVKMHTLDLLGAALVGAELPWILPVRNYALKHGHPARSTVIGSGGEKIDAEFAAMANATAGNAAEIDDYHVGTGHPGCVAVAASLAMAEEQSASGADYLLASVIAFEISSRVNVAATESYLLDRGFHSVSIFGVFGAAASAARLLHLDAAQFLSALSVAASHASGLLECTVTGGEVKRVHAGIGAAGGIRSARLAEFGMTGPRAALEGKKGFLQAFSARAKPELLIERLGQEWALMGCRIKPYSCCAAMFQDIDALKAILAEYPLQPDEIKDLWVGVDRLSLAVVSKVGPEPADMTRAQFSLHYTLAMTVAKGSNEFGAYLDSARQGFKDPDILKLARRVRVDLDPECDAAFPGKWLGKIVITTFDGRVYKSRADGRRAVSRAEVETKFRNLALQTMSPQATQSVIGLVNHIEKVHSTAEISHLLRTSGTRLL